MSKVIVPVGYKCGRVIGLDFTRTDGIGVMDPGVFDAIVAPSDYCGNGIDYEFIEDKAKVAMYVDPRYEFGAYVKFYFLREVDQYSYEGTHHVTWEEMQNPRMGYTSDTFKVIWKKEGFEL